MVFRHFIARLRRKLPYLVWDGQEVDVTVTIKSAPLPMGLGIDEAVSHFRNSPLAVIEQDFNAMGIGFDKGSGAGGRDWEWDWSLSGPISIVFRGPCKTAQRRAAPHNRGMG